MLTKSRKLLPPHQRQLVASAIATDVAQERGYYSEQIKARLNDLGFSKSQWHTPCLVIPIYDSHGKVAFHQIRPDNPREDRHGKTIKYETPKGARMVIDVPPSVRSKIKNPNVPLYVTEGVKKADAAVSQGLCCIALLGVYNWRGTNEDGGTTALADWEDIALNNRIVHLAFDSDAASNPQVQKALSRLKAYLQTRGARVSIINLPSGKSGSKVGLDDYFAAGNTVKDLRKLVSTALSMLSSKSETPAQAERYHSTDGGFVREKITKDGPMLIPLANFTAKITAELVLTDGVEQLRELEIEASIQRKKLKATVAADKFERMDWVVPLLGARAIIHAGYGVKDHVRAAIQFVSENIAEITVHTHLGWVKVDGKWLYLHAGGALGANSKDCSTPVSHDRPIRKDKADNELESIGPKGPILEQQRPPVKVEVRLPPALSKFKLPSPPTGERLKEAVRASMELLDIGPPEVTYPLYAAIWRSAISSVDFSLHVHGPSGAGKSQAAALAQQHFGPEADGLHLPGSWSSTSNALREMAFLAKDALFVVDDFVPTGSQSDIDRAHRYSDELLRAQGNHSGRARCNRDGSPKEAKAPRGLIVSTGEEAFRGASLNARIFTLELDKDDLQWDNVTKCQEHAKNGLFAEAMAAFLSWLAPRFESEREGMEAQVKFFRESWKAHCAHLRTASNAAELYAGFESFIDFAMDLGAITEVEHQQWFDAFPEKIMPLLKQQARAQTDLDPVEQFLSLLGEAMMCGKAHVAHPHGTIPCYDNLEAVGWAERTESIPHSRKGIGENGSSTDDQDEEEVYCERNVRYPSGDKVGWLDDNHLYLLPGAALAVAQRLARDTGAHLALTTKTLGKRLHEKEKLKSRDENRGKYTIRKNLQGGRPDVLHLHLSSVIRPAHFGPDYQEPDYEGPKPDFSSLLASNTSVKLDDILKA